MRRLVFLVLVAWFFAVGCSLDTQATGAGSSPDAGASGGLGGIGGTGGTAGTGGGNCFPSQDQKFCGGQSCPFKDDPSHGCATSSCAPCALPNAITDCAGDGTCGIESCNPGFSDCDAQVGDGCEINTAGDPHHCGDCNYDCFTKGNATNWDCVQGVCKVSKCALGRGDCNQNPNDACEVDTDTDVNNCGFCGNVCNITHAVARCASGQCAIDHCDPGWADCDGNPANGCEQDIATDPTHCGSCTKACDTTNGKAACVAGQCAITCNPGYGNCNGQASDGCEINLQTDASHCGKCATACSTNHATPSCNSGACVLSCQGSWRDCNNVESDGCEANTDIDASHCGSCAFACSTNHATPTCSSGQCSLSCQGAWRDCNGTESDGCEVDTDTAVNHCGGCSTSCSNSHGTPGCSQGNCTIQCSGGYGDCDTNAANGCETNLAQTSTCGSCSNDCTTNVAHASGPTCASGSTCSYTGSCSANWGNCDSNKANGCETSLTQASTCGSCSNDCTTKVVHASGPTCASGSTCSYTGSCASGWGNCDSNKANGCETSLTQTSTCGGCSTDCTSNVQHASGPSCTSSGTCTYSACASGWGNCDSNKANGCETDLTQTTTCGGCNTDCTSNVQHASGPSCTSGGNCTYTGACTSGWGDCDANKANGCEADLTQASTCGDCSTDCTTLVQHAGGASCTSGGSCTYTGACATDWGDCDSDKTNGCETDLTTDTDCGACSVKCVGGLTCKSSAGVYSCSP